MEKEFKKCKIDYCDKKVKSQGYCNHHYQIWLKSGHYGGVYKITIQDKIYIGKSDTSIEYRLKNEKSALKNNLSEPVADELLDYFNKICIERFGEDYLNKELRQTIIEDMMTFETIEEREEFHYTDGSDWNGSKDKREHLSDWNIKYADGKLSGDALKWHKKYLSTIDARETKEINKYRELDLKNGTNNLLNKNKVIK